MAKQRKQSEAELHLQALRHIGGQMANLCYNLSQHAGNKIVSERNAEVMRELYREWDKAILSMPVKKEKAKATHA